MIEKIDVTSLHHPFLADFARIFPLFIPVRMSERPTPPQRQGHFGAVALSPRSVAHFHLVT
jgi:hypothetical protein